MSDFAPTISAAGIDAPDFAKILAVLNERVREIFGDDIYIEPDSQDGQLLGVYSLALSDLNAAAVAAYNAFSPATAQGNGLSSVVKINGLRRKLPSRSQAEVRIGGVVGTVIRNGIVSDGTTRWTFPEVTIPPAGVVTVTATAEVDGAIQAAAGTITQISTPVRGWQTATNPLAAIEGRPVESDAELRIRQTRSVAKPSQSLWESMYAALWQLDGVRRVAGYENPTHEYDANGLPPHSVCYVVEGGDAEAIGQTLLLYKNPGCNTVPDSTTSPPFPSPQDVHLTIKDYTNDWRKINFYRPKYRRIKVAISLEPGVGWSADVQAQLKAAVVTYINGLAIGADVSYFRLSSPINMCNKAFVDAYNVTDIQISADAAPPARADIEIGFREAAQCAVSDVDIQIVTP